ncbi:MAG: choice-of-anchor P family protein [Actinomycetota bacterium]
MSWTRRILVATAATAALVAPLVVPVARADTSIGGFQMSATADAISMIYDQPSFGLPAEHTFELRKVHSVSATDSGPSAHGLSSILWPGDVIGNAPLGLALDLFVQDPTSAQYFTCLGDPHPCVPVIENLKSGITTLLDNYSKYSGQNGFPPYPVRAETFYPQGPADSENPAGAGVMMTAHSDQSLSKSKATLQEAGLSGAFSIGAMTSSTTAGIVDGKAVSAATTKIADIDFGGGALHIGQISSVLRAVSDGTKATLDKSVIVSGLEIGGQKIVVDNTGLHAGGQTQDPVGQISKQLIEKYLTPQGISLIVGKPLDKISGGSASSAVSGLTVTLNAIGMKNIVDQMPDPYKTWLSSPSASPLSPLFGQVTPNIQGLLASPFQFDQNLSFVFGSASVGTAAAPAYNVSIPPVSIPPVSGIAPPISAPSLPTPATPTQVLGNNLQQQLAVTPVAAVAVPIGLVVLALLWMLVGATGLDKMAAVATSSATAEQCPLEKP